MTGPANLFPCAVSVHNRSTAVAEHRLRVDARAMTTSIPPDRPRLILRSGALAAGYNDDEIRRLRRNGRWTSAARGAYFETSALPRLSPADRHRLLIETLVPRLAGVPVVSHLSAAVIHGLPLWRIHLSEVHVTRSPPAKAHRGPLVHSHLALLDAVDVVERGQLAVTSPARTVVDVARVVPFEQAVIVADAALRLGLVSGEQLAAQLKRSHRMPGARAAGRVIAFADGRSESVGESRSRVMLHRAGLPEPELQMTVCDVDGVFLGRADFGYRRRKVLGEFDGKVKYRGGSGAEDPGETVFREKRREDALRAAGWAVVRWIWLDLDEPATVIHRIRSALDRAD